MKKQGTKPTAPKSKKRLRRRIVIATASAVVLGAAVAYAMVAQGLTGNNLGFTIPFLHHAPPQPENILLIGNNARNAQGPLQLGTAAGQADIMMIAHIDPIKHMVTLISIPRDTLFAMPNYNNPIPKLKSFFFIGAQMQPNQAAQLTVQAVEKFTGLHIDHWIVTDFQGFSDAVNAVGGVRVYIPGRIYDPLHSGANLYPGWQTLNGTQALAYIRVRQNTASNVSVNDYERNNAQAQVLMALKAKLLSGRNALTNAPGLIATWMKDVATDMNIGDLIHLAEMVHGSKIAHINLGTVSDSMDVVSAPVQGINQENYLTGAYYDIIDPAKVTATLKPFGSTGADTGVPIASPGSFQVQLYGPQSEVTVLQKQGFNVTYMGGSNVSQDQIMYPTGQLSEGLSVGRALASGNSLVEPGAPGNAVVVYVN